MVTLCLSLLCYIIPLTIYEAWHILLLMTKYKTPDIVSIIKIRRLEWLGHMVRMNETRSVKKIFEGKLEGRRGRGRPRLGFINDVEDDLRKLGVK